ncbi:hypothetical protein [Sporosarcina sp. G11-34]|uniref:hypothetical protein n=1 Tax=Sporosarcina sp. G11-34 TaxID=2849605 RepID=UPI0022A9803F|nr:hypothetical protein [Sporosarcina sp. G11-34]
MDEHHRSIEAYASIDFLMVPIDDYWKREWKDFDFRRYVGIIGESYSIEIFW